VIVQQQRPILIGQKMILGKGRIEPEWITAIGQIQLEPPHLAAHDVETDDRLDEHQEQPAVDVPIQRRQDLPEASTVPTGVTGLLLRGVLDPDRLDRPADALDEFRLVEAGRELVGELLACALPRPAAVSPGQRSLWRAQAMQSGVVGSNSRRSSRSRLVMPERRRKRR
jgi:hypothetical protein